MNGTRFDALAKTLGAAGSRRVALRPLVWSAVAAGMGRLGLDQTTAKKKRKHKKKLKKNEFGCVNVGGKCRGNSAKCCSGICKGKKPRKGKKDKSKCVAHNELDCAAGADSCQIVACGESGFCHQTTGQASFCASIEGDCVACQKDTDCEALDLGPGAACVFVCPGSCPQTGDIACLKPAD